MKPSPLNKMFGKKCLFPTHPSQIFQLQEPQKEFLVKFLKEWRYTNEIQDDIFV